MKVYFDGNFWGHGKYQKYMRRLGIEKEFQWKGCRWRLLGAYVCGQGLVLDFAREVPAADIRAFLAKWKETIRRLEEGEEVSGAEQAWMEYENPTEMRMNCRAWVNGREAVELQGCGTGYCPPGVLAGESGDDGAGAAAEAAAVGKEAAAASSPEAAELMEAYGLDFSCAWSFHRMTLKWDYKRIPRKLGLRLWLLPDRYSLPCEPAFETAAGETGRRIVFTHPLDGTVHGLVVEAVSQDSLPENAFEQEDFDGNERYVFPRHFQELRYYFENQEDSGRFQVRDAEPGDSPVRRLPPEGREPQWKGAAAIGIIGGADEPAEVEAADENVSIIGGADGPISVFLAGRIRGDREAADKAAVSAKPQSCYSASRLCFAPVERTCWQVMADVSRGQELTLELDLSGARS